MNSFICLLLTGFLFFLFPLPPASGQHAGHHPTPPIGEEKKGESPVDRESSSSRVFLLEDGMKASFSILSMAEHQNMLREMKMKAEVDPQATHNIALTLVDTAANRPLQDAVVKMKVIDPKGKEQIKVLDAIPAMNQYAGDFTLEEKGKYEILVLFKIGGKKTAMGFYYVLK